jgi:hypothetical protein
MGTEGHDGGNPAATPLMITCSWNRFDQYRPASAGTIPGTSGNRPGGVARTVGDILSQLFVIGRLIREFPSTHPDICIYDIQYPKDISGHN